MNYTYSNNIDKLNNDIEWDVRSITTLVVCIAIPLMVGGLASFLTKNAMVSFNSMNKPALAPPAWLFPVVWTVLYVLMGVASFAIYKSSDQLRYTGMMLYVGQLIMNFAWSLIFFRLNAYEFAAVWLALIIVLVLALINNTARYSTTAMIMLIPYVLWCGFAMYLNIGIAIKN